jgi:hypothetical protein
MIAREDDPISPRIFATAAGTGNAAGGSDSPAGAWRNTSLPSWIPNSCPTRKAQSSRSRRPSGSTRKRWVPSPAAGGGRRSHAGTALARTGEYFWGRGL